MTEWITRIFPSLLMIGDAGAALVYAASGDTRRAIYWVAALTLTATVTL